MIDYGSIKEEKIQIRNFNFRLLIYVLILSVFGVFIVYSVTGKEVTQSLISPTIKQVIGIGAGLAVLIVLCVIDYHKLVKWSWVLYLGAAALLIYVLLFTAPIYGARRWIYFPMLGTIQPSEFSKPALLVALAFILQKMEDKISKIQVLLLYFAVALPILFLVLKEPDLSTSIVLMIIIVSVLFLGGISYKWILGVIIAAVPLVILFFIAVYQPGQTLLSYAFKPHQIARINAYFFPEQYPDATYQQNISVMAIGSGGLFGKGFNTESLESVKNGNFLSEDDCDFIFAIIGEELGLIGCCFVILMIILIVIECFRISHKAADIAGKVIAGGAGCALGFQAFINMSVALLLIPNTGIPLPFVSAGMSSLIANYILIGLVLSVGLWGSVKRRVVF